MSLEKAYSSNSSQVTSHLPIQNGATLAVKVGPSSASRLASPAALPMVKVPPGIGSISNLRSDPAMSSV